MKNWNNKVSCRYLAYKKVGNKYVQYLLYILGSFYVNLLPNGTLLLPNQYAMYRLQDRRNVKYETF